MEINMIYITAGSKDEARMSGFKKDHPCSDDLEKHPDPSYICLFLKVCSFIN